MSLVVFIPGKNVEVKKANCCSVADDGKTLLLYSVNGISLRKVGEFYDWMGVADRNCLVGVK